MRQNMYTIKIPQIKLFGYHGCYDKEKKEGQEFEIDMQITLNADILITGNDLLSDVLDYSMIYEQIKEKFHSKDFNLLDSLSRELACIPDDLLSDMNMDESRLEGLRKMFHGIKEFKDFFKEVRVRIRKFNPEGMKVPYVEIEYVKKSRNR